jgi:thymidylate synthase (FAD)
MIVQLISYSKSRESSLLEDIAYIARVSNPSNQNNKETSEKLIRYLIKHKHWSPFEMVSVCMEIETTRDIARQILRHRSFSFQEFSQRYADPTQDLDFQTRQARLQDPKNRQNSIEADNDGLEIEWHKRQREVIKASTDAYTWAISNGIAKEQARAVLPEGNTASRMYMNGTLRSWLHYIQIRSGVETQKEHREIALAAARELEPIFPMVTEFIS